MNECYRILDNLERRGPVLAANLRHEEQVALAITRGAPWRVDRLARRMHVLRRVGFLDNPAGGYIVAIEAAQQPGDTVTVRLP
jgi:hypothetical protein